MVPRRLKLAITAQAILDAIASGEEDEIESAYEFLAAYPELLRRLQRMTVRERTKWYASIERALGRF